MKKDYGVFCNSCMVPILSSGTCTCGKVALRVKNNIVKIYTDDPMGVDIIQGIEDDSGRLLKHHQIPFGVIDGIAGIGVQDELKEFFRDI